MAVKASAEYGPECTPNQARNKQDVNGEIQSYPLGYYFHLISVENRDSSSLAEKMKDLRHPGALGPGVRAGLHPDLVDTGLTYLLAQASSYNGCFPSLSSETQRTLGRMDRSERYMNVKLGKTDSRCPSRAEPDVPYVELNFKTPLASWVRTDQDVLTSTYSELNFPKERPRIAEDEDPPISSGADGLSTTAQTGAQKQGPKENIGNRSYRKIYLLCLVTFVLVAIVAGLSIYVSLTRHSTVNCHRNYQAELRHQFTEMERSVNETKAQICELLTSRKEQACSQDWIRNEDSCYFISTFERSYDGAMQYCSNSYSMLLQINSREKENFVKERLRGRDSSFWIGTCKSGKVNSNVVYKVNAGKFECGECKSRWPWDCKNDQHRFICEMPAALRPDVPEKIRVLCQKPVESS
ncbi:uncharacterized protein LOC132389001 [Hypanus sabinus]|uniref:uncharacterized protein LOC132389001 n=1 Tax=Hypanus sabinus TaxID=79690 RepID=UPI0028C4974F|nr:uncharacterized protein LOC132389001 [Hypanus sabinus]